MKILNKQIQISVVDTDKYDLIVWFLMNVLQSNKKIFFKQVFIILIMKINNKFFLLDENGSIKSVKRNNKSRNENEKKQKS